MYPWSPPNVNNALWPKAQSALLRSVRPLALRFQTLFRYK